MSIHLSQVYDYLDTHPLSRYPGNFQSVLEMLHYIYAECNPIDNEAVRAALREFDCLTEKLTLTENDEVFDVVTRLCWEHETAAFSHGIHVGISLMTELNGLP